MYAIFGRQPFATRNGPESEIVCARQICQTPLKKNRSTDFCGVNSSRLCNVLLVVNSIFISVNIFTYFTFTHLKYLTFSQQLVGSWKPFCLVFSLFSPIFGLGRYIRNLSFVSLFC